MRAIHFRLSLFIVYVLIGRESLFIFFKKCLCVSCVWVGGGAEGCRRTVSVFPNQAKEKMLTGGENHPLYCTWSNQRWWKEENGGHWLLCWGGGATKGCCMQLGYIMASSGQLDSLGCISKCIGDTSWYCLLITPDHIGRQQKKEIMGWTLTYVGFFF